MTPPAVTTQLVQRLERTIGAFEVVSLECRVAGDNPTETRLERFGDVAAAATVARPELDFLNRIYGLPLGDAGAVDDVLAFYRSLGLRPWVELPPGTEALAARLADAGGRPVDTSPSSAASRRTRSLPSRVAVRRVEAARRASLRGHVARGARRS